MQIAHLGLSFQTSCVNVAIRYADSLSTAVLQPHVSARYNLCCKKPDDSILKTYELSLSL